MSKAVKQVVIIQNQRGLHARASAQVVKIAESFEAETHFCFQHMRVPAASIMGLLMLGAGIGSELTIEGYGRDADQAVSALSELINNKFGEN